MDITQNKRKLKKMQTRANIIKVARNFFVKEGFLNTTTATIAKQAGIAHGTLFLHFATKEDLILEIIDSELEQLGNQMYELIHMHFDFDSLLKKYLEFIEDKEDFFATMAKELPFYADDLKNKILYRESIIRSHFTQAIHIGIHQGKYKKCEVRNVVITLFGLLNYFLSMKKTFVDDSSQSVIVMFKPMIKKIISNLLIEA